MACELSIPPSSNVLSISLNECIDGFTSSCDKPNAFNASLGCPVGFCKDAIIPLNAVPALSPWIPALERTPIAAAVSDISIPAPAATGATYDMALPICSTLVFAVDAALASISATRSEEHTSELQSRGHLVCRLLL